MARLGPGGCDQHAQRPWTNLLRKRRKKSRIYFIFVPEAALEVVFASKVLRRSAAAVRASPFVKDHVPVTLAGDFATPVSRRQHKKDEGSFCWDFDALAVGVSQAFRREDFLKDLNAEINAHSAAFEKLARHHEPSQLNALLVELVRRAAGKHYSLTARVKRSGKYGSESGCPCLNSGFQPHDPGCVVQMRGGQPVLPKNVDSGPAGDLPPTVVLRTTPPGDNRTPPRHPLGVAAQQTCK